MLDQVAKALWEAQQRAAALFGEVVSSELIEPGILESELSKRIHDLAANKYGCRRHWHKRIVRAGPNTLLTYYDESEDRRIGDDDIVYVDLGPVFEAWEADYGRTFVVGADPVKHALNRDLGVAFAQGKEFFRSNRDLTAGALYDFIAGRAQQLGWTFGAPTAGHLVGHFPHERDTANATRFSIRRGNTQSLREPDDQGRIRHWILEVHFVDKERQIGGFLEELLTIDGPSVS
jgi:Xaa-Pro aminopeptidase